MLNKLIIKSMIYAKRLFFKIVFSIFQEMLNHAIYFWFFFLFFFHVIFVVFVFLNKNMISLKKLSHMQFKT